MPRPQKRSWEVVDLTGDEARPRQAKRPALSSSQSSHLNPVSPSTESPGRGGSRVYDSTYGSSQTVPPTSTAAYEPEVLDLTQEDDGPARELYGTFGMLSTPKVLGTCG